MGKNLQKTILILIALLLFLSGNLLGQDTNNDYAFGQSGTRACFNVNDNAALDVSDFTLEVWVYPTSTSTFYIAERPAIFRLYIINSGGAVVRYDDAVTSISSLVLTLNQWHHIAVVRSGTTTTIYTNGVAGSNANIQMASGAVGVNIGAATSWSAGTTTHKFDELHFTNNAKYTTDFTPSSTTPLGTTDNTIFYFQFENNAEVPSLDDGPLSLVVSNGPTSGTAVAMTTSNYLAIGSGLSLPVELTKFEVVSKGDNVVLEWSTATEVNNYGFEVERALADNFEVIGFVEGAGNSNSPKQYTFVDADNSSSEVSYRLKQIDTDGGFEYSEVVKVKANNLVKTELFQNHPNPFNPTTKINFTLAQAQSVKLTVYNTLGQQVAELVNGEMNAGLHSIDFNAFNLTSGFYIYRIETKDYAQTMKMLLLK